MLLANMIAMLQAYPDLREQKSPNHNETGGLLLLTLMPFELTKKFKIQTLGEA